MVTDTFFDLQRFADDILVGDGEKFVWQGGSSFGGDDTVNAPYGSAINPAYLSKTDGVSKVIGTSIHLIGTEEGYSFAINETKDDWEISNIQGEDNVISGDFSTEDGAYELDGNVDVKAFATTESFSENVNGQSVAIKATGSDPVEFNIQALEGSDAFIYNFKESTDGVMVDVDDDDTAIFAGKATNVTFAEGDDAVVYGFENAATVSGQGNELQIITGDNVIAQDDEKIIIDTADDSVATLDANGINGVSSVAFDTTEGIEDITVNGSAWGTIEGALTGVKFEDINGEVMAHVKNTGAVTVDSAEGQKVAFDKITTAATEINGATVTGIAEGNSFAVELAGASKGFKSIGFDGEDPFVKVAGVQSFQVLNAGASYTVSTSADDITFDGNAKEAIVLVKDGEEYTVAGVDAIYSFDSGIKESNRGLVTINDANVTINNNNDTNVFEIKSTEDTDGINEAILVAGDAINVSGDDDGYSAIFQSNGKGENVTLEANGYQIAVDDDDIGDSGVTMFVSPDDDDPASVTGLKSTVVTIPGGDNGVYQFKDDSEKNRVTATTSDLSVTLDSAGNVADVVDADTQKKLDALEDKWEEIATLGSSDDTVKLHHGKVYENFYNLANSAIAGVSFAGYDYDDDSIANTVSSAIDLTGSEDFASAKHVTLEVGDGTYVGQVPLNIEKNESDAVVDVTIDMSKSRYPSTVAVGTQGEVTASHKITLSNASDKPNYGYIGEYATGNNVLQAGTGAAMLRHDGDTRTSLLGGAGNDSIIAGKNDIVKGGDGNDLFFDTASYTVQDYTSGDVIVATKLKSVSSLTPDQITGTGNKVAIAGGKELTIGSNDGKDALHIKVAAMDDDANVLKARADVVLANGNGDVDASSAGSNGAMILAGDARGNGVHNIIGSAGDDLIVAGANDTIDGGDGNDFIYLDSSAESSGAVIKFGTGDGKDTVYGWQEGFVRADGATRLDLDGESFGATIIEDQLAITVGSGATMIFADSYAQDSHFDLVIDGKKYSATRTEGVSFIDDNDNIADLYWSQSKGGIWFTEDVTKDLGMIDLNDTDHYQNIDKLYLGNSSKASVMGTDGQDIVYLGGVSGIGASKTVSLDAGNDIIFSGGDISYSEGELIYGGVEKGASHTMYFGAGDGRDSIFGFNRYEGFESDPQKQSADLLIVDHFANVTTADYVDEYGESGTRILFSTSDTDEIAIYETDFDEDNMYRVKINGFDETAAKFGKSEGGNTFTYSDEVKYYVGKGGEATDILTVDNAANGKAIWLDSSKDGEFYRGIGVVDARAVTSNVSIVGSMDNNTIYGGGADSKSYLWGGAGDNVLIGGAGKDTFLYYQYSRNYIDGAAGMANANKDVIRDYDASKDTIFLGDITIDDINFEATSISDNSVVVTMNNGGTLTVEGTQETTRFTLSDGNSGEGQVWSASRSNRSWTREV